jgi:17beta-estradiol 17-dehydrogenase / very-long-chain 3-oxoacyl-CoA reductase
MDKLDKFVLDNKRAVGVFAAGAAAVVGAKILAKSLSFLVKTLTPSYDLIERYGSGSYAVVSAATDGIGKGFALQLAKRGFNLVMLIRNKEKGEALA